MFIIWLNPAITCLSILLFVCFFLRWYCNIIHRYNFCNTNISSNCCKSKTLYHSHVPIIICLWPDVTTDTAESKKLPIPSWMYSIVFETLITVCSPSWRVFYPVCWTWSLGSGSRTALPRCHGNHESPLHVMLLYQPKIWVVGKLYFVKYI